VKKGFSRMENYGQNCVNYMKLGFQLVLAFSMWVVAMARLAERGLQKIAESIVVLIFRKMLLMKR